MATRAIITHQPDVSCDMCGRRLLRGERPDVFLAAGSRRTVCELCIPRAAGEGWTRESDALAAAGADSQRMRRGRSLLDRLRQRRGLEEDAAPRAHEHEEWEHDPVDAWQQPPADWSPRERRRRLRVREAGQPHTESFEVEPGRVVEPEPQDFERGPQDFAADPLDRAPLPDRDEWVDRVVEPEGLPAFEDDLGAEPPAQAPTAEPIGRVSGDLTAEQAIEIFNASECAGRVAGIARALGRPTVTVRQQETAADRVAVVVAWELCWYRYEVDLGERPATIALLGDGTELDELPADDKLGNASADERGELRLLR